jgi:hypothetical protein
MTEAASMTCDLFIRSYWKDLEWLRFCLESAHRYCHGFRSVIVVVPRATEPWLKRAGLQPPGRIEFCQDYCDDYLGQQVSKLLADKFSDADFICHVDSDCVFCRPTAPENLIVDGKPRVLMQSNELLGRHRPWQKPTEAFLGCTVLDDFMRQPPFTYPRWLYECVRKHVSAVHHTDIESYIMRQPPRGFSEFNALGAYAWQYHHDDFSWVDTAVTVPPLPHCRWYWSWGGINRATRQEIQDILDGSAEQIPVA